MRHERHDALLNRVEGKLRHLAAAKGQKFILVVYDGPTAAVREASYISNADLGDVSQVCHAVADQIRSKAN